MVTALKRDTPSFTVEVRQNKRRNGLHSPKPHWVDAHLNLAKVEKPAQRAAAAAFRPAPLFAVEAPTPTEPPAPRRILPSLVETPADIVEAPSLVTSDAIRPRRGRPPKAASRAVSTEEAPAPARAEASAGEFEPPARIRSARKPRRIVEMPAHIPPPSAEPAPSPSKLAEAKSPRAGRKLGLHGFRDGFKPGEGWKRRREARRSRRD